ncbi:mate-domain-containing protein [Fennellomyces sp. T-0311]|nr:mate-domain-containing protein [Fennellomyces sp. T-0311]
MTVSHKLWAEETRMDERTALITRFKDTGAAEDFWWLLKKGLMISGTILLHQIMEITTISMVGHLGAQQLAAVTLANMLIAVFGACITAGISNTLETLCSQAYTGAKDKTMVGVYFQRVYFVLCVWFIPMGIVLWNGKQILLTLGQEPELAEYAGSYLRCIFPSFMLYITFDAHRKYLQVQGAVVASTCIMIVSAPMNAVLQYFFIFYMKMGLMGAPLAMSIVYLSMLGSQLYYSHFIRTSPVCCWGGWSTRCLQDVNWREFFKLIIYNAFVICSEYYVAELSILAISYLGETTLIAAGSVVLRSHISSHAIPFALAAASATRVGLHMGKGSAKGARQSFLMGCWVSLFLSLPLSLLFWLSRDSLPYLFTKDEVVAQLITNALPILAAFQLVGMLAAQASGVFRGLGRQQISAYISIVAFYCVALPIGYVLVFKSGWSINGVWTAFGIGYFVYALAQILFLLMVDWSAECAKVHEHLAADDYQKD